ncbi:MULTISPECIES: hypothetical protein [unclassified Nocardioides]|uniref:hypothetical protein n=1 Tax=unclassified Nocardioides TaxID=2615069 RepID=UPI0036173038
MVGRIPRARRHARWAGPPPLLLLATVLGVLVAPAVAEEQPSPRPAASARPTVSTVSTVSVAATPRSIEPQVVRADVAPLEPALDIGVASMNMLRLLSPQQAGADARRLTTDPAVDVVGWQEAQHFGPVLRALPGWRTATFERRGEISELAVSWRAEKFRLVRSKLVYGVPGVDVDQGRYPFAGRRIAVVTLEHRASGRRLTVLDAHLPMMIEDDATPGRWAATLNARHGRRHLARIAQAWRRTDNRWVVGTGDFNFDARADARRLPAGGPTRMLGRVAISSYRVLGAGTPPTYPERERRIDYVWVDRAARKAGRMELLRHWVLPDFNSDHRPIVARLRLT